MDYFKRLIDLALGIGAKDLREKVIDILKNPSLSNEKFKYKGVAMREAPASLNWHHVQEGGLAMHTCVVTQMCMTMADVLGKNYEVEIDRDALIAGALLHDIAKLFDLKKGEGGFDTTELKVDHLIMGCAELYARGFPESVIYLVASHAGDQGTTTPQTVESLILYHADTISAALGTSKLHKLVQLLSQ